MLSINTETICAIAELFGIAGWAILFIALLNAIVPVFCGERREKISAAMFALVLLAAEIAFWFVGEDGFPAWIILLAVITLGFVLLSRREKLKETLFALCLFINFRYLSFVIVNSMVNTFSNVLLTGFEQAPGANAAFEMRAMAISIAAELMYIIVLAAEILPFARLARKMEIMSIAELFYLSVLNPAGIILTRIMLGLAVLATPSGTIVLFDEKPYLVLLLPIVSILLYLGELSVVVVWQKYKMYRRRDELCFVRTLEEEAIRRRLDDTERYYDEVRKARHEMTNHLTNISGLAELGRLDELRDYITHIDATVRAVELRYATGNPVTDVVINDRCKKAEERGIVCSLVFFFNEGWGIAVYDLSIVLSNILDNAIKASEASEEGNRYIELKTLEKESVVLLVCENSCGVEKPRAEDYWHGIGLKNVEAIAERYNGTVLIKKEENSFAITVMLRKNTLM